MVLIIFLLMFTREQHNTTGISRTIHNFQMHQIFKLWITWRIKLETSFYFNITEEDFKQNVGLKSPCALHKGGDIY